MSQQAMFDKKLINFSDDDWVSKKLKHPKRTINVGTLFSGIGAIEYSFKRLNLKSNIVFACDNDKFCKETYFANYKIDEKDWYEDVTSFNAKKYKYKVDLLVGGSPCQSFSMVGKRLGLEDTRGTLFYDFARIVDETKPRVFIFENVQGLVNHDKGNTFKVIKDVLEDLGYDIHYKLLNGKDYGIPQNRTRIFILGFRKKTDFKFPKPIELNTLMKDFLEDSIESKYFLKEKGVKFVTSSKNFKKRYTQINGEIALCQKANQQFNWHGDFVFEDFSKHSKFDGLVLSVEEIEEKCYRPKKVKDYVLSSGTKNFKTSTKTDLDVARPLLTTMHKMHRAGVDNYITYPRGKIRKLTPRECLRLMGFRDDFKIVVSDTQMYRQAGNSIIVDVLIALLKEMDITLYGRK